MTIHTGLLVKDEIDGNSEESTLTGISSAKNESIDIPTQILQEINSTGTCKVCIYVHIYNIYISSNSPD